jgi:hypothetical protein
LGHPMTPAWCIARGEDVTVPEKVLRRITADV